MLTLEKERRSLMVKLNAHTAQISKNFING